MVAKKPVAKRQRGTRTRDVGVVLVQSVAEPPLPTGGKPLLKATKDAWSAFWSTPEIAALVKPADHPALGRLFRMYDMRERLERLVLKQPFVKGSTGQDVINPAAKEIASLDGRITALEDRFGVTPMARLKLGLAFGEAARSLDRLNREFDADDDSDEGEEDPRLAEVIDI